MTIPGAQARMIIAFFGLGSSLFAWLMIEHNRAVGQVTSAAPVTQSATHRGLDLSRIVVWKEAAGGYPTPRGFHPVLLSGGWKQFVAQVIQPEIDWLRSRGVQRPRVILHNPYGLERDASGKTGEYRYSQRRLCQANPATRHLASGLGDALRPLTKAGVEVIVYFGALQNDPTEVLPKIDGRADDFIRECEYQIKEALDAGCSIAFDASSNLSEDSPQWRWIAMVGSLTRAYIEPRPHASRGQMFGFPVITQDAFWDRSNPEKYPDSRWGARNDALSGEIIRFVQFPDPPAHGKDVGWNDTPDNIAARLIAPAIRIQADGHTPALTTKHIRLADK
jgi:hypothetical protein